MSRYKPFGYVPDIPLEENVKELFKLNQYRSNDAFNEAGNRERSVSENREIVEQAITDLDLMQISAEQSITDLDLRVIELEG